MKGFREVYAMELKLVTLLSHLSAFHLGRERGNGWKRFEIGQIWGKTSSLSSSSQRKGLHLFASQVCHL